MTEDLKHLGQEVQQRRKEKGWSQIHVWKENGGPSNTKLTQIEAGLAPAPSPSTQRKLDVGLKWTPGSTREVLAGGRPSPLEETILGSVGLDESHDFPSVESARRQVEILTHDLAEAEESELAARATTSRLRADLDAALWELRVAERKASELSEPTPSLRSVAKPGGLEPEDGDLNEP